MCGIAGVINFNSKGDGHRELLALLKILRHRGPDDIGLYSQKNVNIGMRRLSIIDIDKGNQPLTNEKGDIKIIGNGEIYNYIELQTLLSKKGHKLKTGSDIETAVHLYEEYGINFAKYLRGMFALAIFDIKKQQLILIRDRMGEKPIYYFSNDDKFVFASELKALIKVKMINKEIDLSAVNDYLHYYYVPEPKTIFKHIKKIPAGHYLILDVKTGKSKLAKYFDFSSIRPAKTGSPEKEIRTLLKNACEVCLRSDVEVGISLSGGLDSGSILALIAPKLKKRIKAFTVGYEGKPKSDERDAAAILARTFNTRHFTKVIKTSDFVNKFPQIVFHSDEPIADIASYPIFEVSRLARKHNIKVILGGLGGDELFWGYGWLRKEIKEDSQLKNTPNAFYKKTKQYLQTDRYLKFLLSPHFIKQIKKDNRPELILPASKIEIAKKGMDAIRDIWLITNCNTLADRLSMASSVEMRSPFLDYRLAEAIYRSKECVLAFKKDHKYWLKKIMKKYLPAEVIYRRKAGFQPPIFQWLFALNKNYLKLLPQGFLVQSGIVTEKAAGFIKHTWFLFPYFWYMFYQMLVLEVWGREYVWGQKPARIIYAKK